MQASLILFVASLLVMLWLPATQLFFPQPLTERRRTLMLAFFVIGLVLLIAALRMTKAAPF